MEVVDTQPVTPIDSDINQPKKSKRGGKRPGAGRTRTNPPPDKINGTEREVAGRKGLHLPQLPHGRHAKLEELIAWWHSLTEEQLKHAVFYFYRTWPVWQATKFDPKAQKNIKIVTGACPYTTNNFEREFMSEFGSGDYYISVNEDSIHRWDVYFKTTRDLENYAPVLDYRLLDLSDPANKTFIAWARGKGRLQDIDLPQTESDMAANEAFNRVLDITERQSERILDLSAQAAQRPEPPDTRAHAEMRGMELVQEGAKETIGFMRETMSEMTRSQTRNADPIEMMEKVGGLITSLNGGGGKHDAILEMMRADRDAATRREEALQRELADNRKMMFEMMQRRKTDEDEEDSPKGLMGMLTQFKALKEVAGDLGFKPLSPTENGDAADKAKKDTMLELLLRNAPVIMTGLDSIVGKALTVLIAMKGGQVQQTAPQANGQPQPANNPAATLNAPPAAPITPLTPFLQAITHTFLHHMTTEGLGGDTFARWLIDAGPITTWPQPGMNGRGVYDFLKESGKEAITQVLQTHPPIWQTAGQTPKKLEEFIDQLLKADDMQDEDEGEETAGGKAAGA